MKWPTNEQLVDTVLAARDRVADSWTRGARARRAPDPGSDSRMARHLGAAVPPTSSDAETWCAVGAVQAVALRGYKQTTERAVLLAFRHAGVIQPLGRIEGWNDGKTDKAEVVEGFDVVARWLKDTGWEPTAPPPILSDAS